MIYLPKLDFLYFNLEQTKENFINCRELYNNIVDWDEINFNNYAKSCSFEELIYLMIYIYKDKYPRNIFDSAISVDFEKQNLMAYSSNNGRIISENKYIFNNFLRKDVTGMISQFHSEQYPDEEIIEKYWDSEFYIQNLFLEFNKDAPIHVIDLVLEGKEYTKTEKDHVLVYEVKDSPIASLEVTGNSIKLNVNEDKVVLYVSIY